MLAKASDHLFRTVIFDGNCYFAGKVVLNQRAISSCLFLLIPANYAFFVARNFMFKQRNFFQVTLTFPLGYLVVSALKLCVQKTVNAP